MINFHNELAKGGEQMTKKTLFTVSVVSLLSGGLVVAANAFAQTPTASTSPSLVQEISNKFHLNQSDVQAVFSQYRQETQAKRESNYQTYLANLVKNGKITEGQEQLILNKHQQLISQMQSDMKNFKTMTPAERKAQKQSELKDLQNWAKQNNIKLQYLRPFGMGRFGKLGVSHSTPTPTP